MEQDTYEKETVNLKLALEFTGNREKESEEEDLKIPRMCKRRETAFLLFHLASKRKKLKKSRFSSFSSFLVFRE